MPRSQMLVAALAGAAAAAMLGWLAWLAWPVGPQPRGGATPSAGVVAWGAPPGPVQGGHAPADGREKHARTPGMPAPPDHHDVFLDSTLRDTLEAMLLEAGDAGDPATLKQRLAALVGRYFPAPLAARALAMAERYVDYRVALGQLRTSGDPGDPAVLRKTLAAREQLRHQHFQDDEYQALFGREAELDQYTLAQLEIARNPALTPDQKEHALRESQAGLPPERQAERATATVHMAVARQTQDFDAQGIDERARYATRSAQYGDEAAHALAQLDRDEKNWQGRLDQYRQAQAQTRDAAALQQVRGQLFTPEEQLRLPAALALRQQQDGARRP
jgi:lipase chaperone LimK